MPYVITAFEPMKERRDSPDKPDRTHRTVASAVPFYLDAVSMASGLLNTHAEVAIHRREGDDEYLKVDEWIPKSVVLWTNPELMMTDETGRTTEGVARVNRHHYEYTSTNGQRLLIIFETLPGKKPAVPNFGTCAALRRLSIQWKCWDCAGTGIEGGRECGPLCNNCSGTGRR